MTGTLRAVSDSFGLRNPYLGLATRALSPIMTAEFIATSTSDQPYAAHFNNITMIIIHHSKLAFLDHILVMNILRSVQVVLK